MTDDTDDPNTLYPCVPATGASRATDDPNTFRVRDVVRLSNVPGPKMIVSRIGTDGVECTWFSHRGECYVASFDARLLSKTAVWVERDGPRPPRVPTGPEFHRTDAGARRCC